MQVFIAEPCGFCYGVKRAVEMARGECGKEGNPATLGPLIHNPQLIDGLAQKGVGCKDSLDDLQMAIRLFSVRTVSGPKFMKKQKQRA